MPQHDHAISLADLPADFLSDDENDATYDFTVEPDPALIASVEALLTQPRSTDGLESRYDEDEGLAELAVEIQDWRTLAPDDPKGEMLQCRVSSAIVSKMDNLIARTRSEVWRTRSDFQREAVWHYIRAVLHGLQTRDPVLVSLLTESELAGRAAFHAARRTRLEKSVQDITAYLTDIVNLDDHEEAHRVLQETAVRLRRMQVGPWRRQWLLSLNAIPILKITVRMLDMYGWDIPVEFYPAAGKAIGAGPGMLSVPPPIPVSAPASPTGTVE